MHFQRTSAELWSRQHVLSPSLHQPNDTGTASDAYVRLGLGTRQGRVVGQATPMQLGSYTSYTCKSSVHGTIINYLQYPTLAQVSRCVATSKQFQCAGLLTKTKFSVAHSCITGCIQEFPCMQANIFREQLLNQYLYNSTLCIIY